MSITKEQVITFIKLHKSYYGDDVLSMEEIDLDEIMREIKNDVCEDYEPEQAQVIYDFDHYEFITWFIITFIGKKKRYPKKWNQLLISVNGLPQ
jgi:hypothetical protein